jgi:hypothetical protein
MKVAWRAGKHREFIGHAERTVLVLGEAARVRGYRGDSVHADIRSAVRRLGRQADSAALRHDADPQPIEGRDRFRAYLGASTIFGVEVRLTDHGSDDYLHAVIDQDRLWKLAEHHNSPAPDTAAQAPSGRSGRRQPAWRRFVPSVNQVLTRPPQLAFKLRQLIELGAGRRSCVAV